ncbi:MAG: hypothetical protein SWX82_09870 [Cyanobacteriota bacterium]|nr:hypothetical protein [Cyanobacteriota bacterium]
MVLLASSVLIILMFTSSPLPYSPTPLLPHSPTPFQLEPKSSP